jgi:hypothetical protein
MTPASRVTLPSSREGGNGKNKVSSMVETRSPGHLVVQEKPEGKYLERQADSPAARAAERAA